MGPCLPVCSDQLRHTQHVSQPTPAPPVPCSGSLRLLNQTQIRPQQSWTDTIESETIHSAVRTADRMNWYFFSIYTPSLVLYTVELSPTTWFHVAVPFDHEEGSVVSFLLSRWNVTVSSVSCGTTESSTWAWSIRTVDPLQFRHHMTYHRAESG